MLDRFNLTMGAIMASNPGFNWNWNTDSLKGMTVGISVRESEYNGCIFTEIGKFIPVSVIRNGTFRPMKRRSSQIIQGYPPATSVTRPISDTIQQPISPVIPSSAIPSVPEIVQQPVPVVSPTVYPPEASLLPAHYTDDQDTPF